MLKKESIRLDSRPLENFIDIEIFLNYYEDKEEFLESIDDLEKRNHIITKIYPKEKGRIGEIGWKVIFKVSQRKLSFEVNRQILYLFLKQVPIYFNDFKSGTLVDYPGLKPKEKDILISIPSNGLMMPTNSPNLYKKRGYMNTKFGFGDLDQYGYQYARFDRELNLIPI
jgi:hypothetical protein